MVRYIQRYGGAYKLDEDDYNVIKDHFPLLVNIADTCGGVHKSFISAIMEDFIYETNYKTLSPQARQLLYLQELKKPAELRGLNEWPAWNINNKNYLESRKQKEIQALAEFEQRIEIEKAEKEIRDQAERLLIEDVEALYNLAKEDYENDKFENGQWIGKPKFTVKAEVYKKAWEVYCKESALNKKVPSTRDLCISDLKITFARLFSNNNNDNDNENI